DFEVDEFSNEYLALHPMPSTTKKASLLEEQFEAVEDEDEKAIVVLMYHQRVNCETMSMKTQRPNPRRKYKLLGETHVSHSDSRSKIS
ncbi:UNVERIFIED_CONTAM: hypothetical protein Sindi_2961600, partial [Sesamum indicum]